METWNNNLEGLLNSGGYFRIKELNEHIFNWCSLWVDEVDRFDGLHATVSTKYPQQSLVEVKQREYSTITFFCYLHYSVSSDKQIELIIKSVTGFNYGNFIRKTIEADADTSDCYIWEEASFEGEEIFQKGFVLENLNLALARFLKQCGERNY
jgi:hypothetical protein